MTEASCECAEEANISLKNQANYLNLTEQFGTDAARLLLTVAVVIGIAATVGQRSGMILSNLFFQILLSFTDQLFG